MGCEKHVVDFGRTAGGRCFVLSCDLLCIEIADSCAIGSS